MRRVGYVLASLVVIGLNWIEKRHGKQTRAYNQTHKGAVSTRRREAGE